MITTTRRFSPEQVAAVFLELKRLQEELREKIMASFSLGSLLKAYRDRKDFPNQ